MTEKTKTLLLAMKAAGYEHATVFVHDKRVPDSVRIRKGSTGWEAGEDGMVVNEYTDEKEFFCKRNGGYCFPGEYWGHGVPEDSPKTYRPFKVICGAPSRTMKCNRDEYNGRLEAPAIKIVLQRLGLVGTHQGVSGDGHDIKRHCCKELSAGYYNLAELS